MSIDKSLKTKGKLVRPRNVLTRIERIKLLREEKKWEPTISVFGIPKVKVLKLKQRGKAEKKAKPEATAAAAGGEVSATAGKEKAKK
ncbi:MAG: small basic protein [Candidatus Jettenia sp.]|uniref:Small basic protein n=1 Tax=Candidatus Jettenia caeni TaxID=247490 RepID=I3ILW6_9BACT|nr:small basic protein [Candidatus Jettenia sp. AMX1]MBC6928119.1 small basic protein [Candidatus Jettenia sp.]NUN24501.1 small basic protein [Candidatus Jettenia caeni]KAA0249470.1 MAG: small basic protein [Candidatus Jettenia sp. AMX1]MCE7879211.1 small basic protein [Candidatus Jettenia sp. AMX1]MCQ3925972.1 small basic protein [Candidatus Jettenia sp.]